jgi:hypothetical protein
MTSSGALVVTYLRSTGAVTETDTTAQSRTWLPVAAAAAVAVLVVVGVVLANLGGPGDSFSLASSATIPSGHAADAVVRDGDTVRGSGLVVAVPGQPVRFCAPVATGGSTPLSGCPVGVRVTGVDLSRLTSIDHDRGTVNGMATLTGSYRAGTIAVTDQSPYHLRKYDPYDDQPPCGEPDGGWPKGEVNPDAASSYRSRNRDTVELVAIMRPAKGESVLYVVTDGDPTAAGNALLPVYGKALCAVRGKYTTRQIETARAMLDRHVGSGLTKADSAGGPTIDRQGRVQVTADVPVIDDAFAKDVDAQPAGLVQLTVWLRPTGN